MAAITDSGAITGMDAREDGVYITYIPSNGADAVTKKLGKQAKIMSMYQYSNSTTNEWHAVELKIDTTDCSLLSCGTLTGSSLPRCYIKITKETGVLLQQIAATNYKPAVYDVSDSNFVTILMNRRYSEDKMTLSNIVTE